MANAEKRSGDVPCERFQKDIGRKFDGGQASDGAERCVELAPSQASIVLQLRQQLSLCGDFGVERDDARAKLLGGNFGGVQVSNLEIGNSESSGKSAP